MQDRCNNEFLFSDGKLAPYALKQEDEDFDQLIERLHLSCDSFLSPGNDALYAGKMSDGAPCWLLTLGDCQRAALIFVVGWLDFFDALRYFAPVLTFIMRTHIESKREAEGRR